MAVSVIGHPGAFDADQESWTQYSERVDFFFQANEITDASKKRATLLAIIGPSAYKLLRSLVAPKKPDEKTYAELVAAMANHHNPAPSEIVQRYRFNSRSRKEGESVATYLSELRSLAEHCNYQNNLDDMLRDRLVCGIENKSIQKRLLAEAALTLKKATELALAMETAEANAETLQSTSSRGGAQELRQPVLRMQSTQRGQPSGNSAAGACYRCGQKSHKAPKCPYKEAKCHNCGKVGHLKKVCRKSSQSTSQGRGRVNVMQDETQEQELITDDTQSEYQLFTVTSSSNSPLRVEMKLGGKPHTMEIDTGASMSVISKTTYQREFSEFELQGSSVRLTTYGGEPLSVCGEMVIDVVHGDNKAKLPLLVVDKNGPSLLGRNWLASFHLDWNVIHKVQESKLSNILDKYKSVFTPGLGTLAGFEAKIHIEPNACPRFCQARSVPFAMKALVEKELDNLKAQGIIEPVAFSEWAAPIVPVLKADKTSVRLCGDFKLTVNRVAKLDRYPIPKVYDLFSNLSGGKYFTKLDLSQAYLQVSLDEHSKSLAVVNTHKGLFRYNRLPYGISSAPAIFQRIMESLLKGIPHVVSYLDDILISGSTVQEHMDTLEQVLSRLEKAGLKLQQKKCTFMVSEVIYLGHKIDAQGLRPLAEKVEAIQAAPVPKNVTELKSYLGLLSYYGKFLPKLSTTLAPLYELLKSTVKWRWRKQENAVFQESKKRLSSAEVLVHYDPTKEVTLACDASPYGIGAVLSHKMPDGSDRPIGFASRTLSSAEKGYAQLEKEGLSCVFGVKKFHTYLYGRPFILITDHKPLLGLLKEQQAIPAHASARIQRWALTLASYEYKLQFRESTAHSNADALSRLPLSMTPATVPDPPEIVLLMDHLGCSPVRATEIEKETAHNPLLSRVLQFVRHGWPDFCNSDELKPYWLRRLELSAQGGCLIWGNRVVVPPSLRQRILLQLHDTHMGISRMKSLGRMFVWWPGFDSDLEGTVRHCDICQRTRPTPPVAPLHPWAWPSRPWSRIHMDYAGPYLGHRFLVVIDAHSKWIEVIPMNSTTTTATVEKLRIMFAQFGIPEVVVSDNGTNFVSKEFEEFMRRNGIKHVTSAPAHPSSNGLAENAVKTCKNGISRLKDGSITDKLSRFLFAYRNTPHATTGSTPAELMMGRRLRSTLDLAKPDLENRVAIKQDQQKQQHDKHARQRAIQVGDTVYAKNLRPGPTWMPATVIAQTGPVSYRVELENSKTVWRRHQDQLRERYENSTNIETDGTVDESTSAEQSDSLIDVDVIPTDATNQSSNSTNEELSTSSPTSTSVPSSAPAPRRNPSRIRKAPDRLAY